MGTSPPPQLVVRPAEVADKVAIRQLMQLYLYDFSEFDGSDVGAHGEFDYRYLDNYWSEADRHPFVFEVAGAKAGFALVRAGTPHDMAEFFVLRKYRRGHVGKHAAALLFDRFPGAWQVRQLDSNPVATAFWRATLPYPFTETANEDGLVQRFTVTSSP